MRDNRILQAMRPLLIGLLFTIPANFANAQNFGKKLLVLPKTGAPAEKTTVKQSGIGNMTAASATTLNGASALSNFKIIFTNGDHKFKQAAILPEVDKVTVVFADSDNNDPYDFEATWWNIPGAQSGRAYVDFRQYAIHTIPDGPPDTTFTLNGFTIRMREGRDCDIENFKIMYDKRYKNITVDSSTNCEEQKYGYIHYTWIPNSYIKDNKNVSGSDRQASKVSGILPPDDKYVIRGFGFKFKNGAHFLNGMGVNLTASNGEVITWQDSNRDDPIEWEVEYSTLK